VNRKILLTVLALAVVLLATPYVGMVHAGKGQSKLDFRLVIVGTYGPPIDRELLAGSTAHYWGLSFYAFPWPPTYPALVLEIGGVPVEGTLSYAGDLYTNENLKNGASSIKVIETITVEGRGTLEIQAMGNVEQGQGVGAGIHFNGFGTGEFAGAKVSGITESLVVIGMMPTGQPPPAPAEVPVLQVTRVGTVMGWP